MSFFQSEEEKEQFRDWVCALEFGGIPQATGGLELESGFCCMGVAVAMFVETPIILYRGFIEGGLPTYHASQGCPSWLMKINEESYVRTSTRLAVYNDVQRKPFPEIAQILKQTFPEAYE